MFVWVDGCLSGGGEGDADATPRISSRVSSSRGHRHRCGYRGPVVQTTLQKRILRAFVARGLLENCDAKDMPGLAKHSGSRWMRGCIEARPRAALERLLRYCARPPFSVERLRQGKQTGLCTAVPNSAAEPPVTSVVPRQMNCTLTAGTIDRIAALVPPPRTHRHR